MDDESIVIKGTILTHGKEFYVGDEIFSSILLSVANSWYYSNFTHSGILRENVDSTKAREYGKIKFALYGFTDDLNNISINFCLLKEIFENKNLNAHKANLYIALILENLFTNIRSLYDFLFHFIKICLSDKQLKEYPQNDSLNNLIKFSRNINNQIKLPEKIIWYLNNIEADLNNIRSIRDNIIHKGKEILLTRLNNKIFMRVPKTEMFSQDNLLPDILLTSELNFDVNDYINKLIKITLENIETLGVIIYNEIYKQENYKFELYSISNYCMKDFNNFLIYKK